MSRSKEKNPSVKGKHEYRESLSVTMVALGSRKEYLYNKGSLRIIRRLSANVFNAMTPIVS